MLKMRAPDSKVVVIGPANRRANGGGSQGLTPNFTLLDLSRPEIAGLLAAMLQARSAVERRSWSQPQEPTGEEWWADVLADPRAHTRSGPRDFRVKQAFYRLRDEARATILIACSECDWKAAFSRDDLIGSYGTEYLPLSLRRTACNCASMAIQPRTEMRGGWGFPLIRPPACLASAIPINPHQQRNSGRAAGLLVQLDGRPAPHTPKTPSGE